MNRVEQTRVLDGNDRLVGEGLSQSDLLCAEGPNLGAAHRERPDSLIPSQQGNRQNGPETLALGQGAAFWEIGFRGYEVGHMDRLAIQNGATGRPAPCQRPLD